MSAPYYAAAVRSDWATPQPLFDQLDAEFHFTLDAAADPQNAKCERLFTRENDSLQRDWGRHVVWLNPPYGRSLGRWIRKAYSAAQLGATVVCLVPARTDTAWWHDYAQRTEHRFVRGRIYCVRPDGSSGRAPFPSVIVVFRPPLRIA